MRDRLLNLLKLGLSVALLVLLLSRVGLGKAISTLASARWSLLGLALALWVFGIAFRALRWRALLRAKGLEVPLARLVILYYVGSFFNTMLPTGVGGDAVRAYELSRYTRSPELGVGTVLMDRAVGLVVQFLMALAALPFLHGLLPPWVAALVLALAAGSCAVLVLLFWSRPLAQLYRRLPLWLRTALRRPALRRLYDACSGYGWRALAAAAGVSVAFNLLLVAVNVLAGLALGARVGLGYYVVFVSLISFASALPISLGGLGVREGAYQLLFGQVGVPGAVAVSLSLAVYLINALSGLIGGAMYAWEGAYGAWRQVREEP